MQPAEWKQMEQDKIGIAQLTKVRYNLVNVSAS